MQAKALEFKRFHTRRTADEGFAFLLYYITDWELTNEDCAITTENADMVNKIGKLCQKQYKFSLIGCSNLFRTHIYSYSMHRQCDEFLGLRMHFYCSFARQQN